MLNFQIFPVHHFDPLRMTFCHMISDPTLNVCMKLQSEIVLDQKDTFRTFYVILQTDIQISIANSLTEVIIINNQSVSARKKVLYFDDSTG